MQRLENAPAAYTDLACYLQADDLEPLPTDIFDFIDELELHDCAASAPAGQVGQQQMQQQLLQQHQAPPVSFAHQVPQQSPNVGAGATCPTNEKNNDSRIDRIRQRNREAQARFRLKQKGHRQEVETKVQVTQASISQVRRKIKQLKQARAQMAERQERADIMLEATLHITAAMHVPENGDDLPCFRQVSARPAVQPDGRNQCAALPQGMGPAPPALPPKSSRASGLAPPPLTAFHTYLPLSYDSVLQHSGTESAAFTAQPACATAVNCSVPGGLRGKCQQFRADQAAKRGVRYSQIAWFPQMQTEVEAGVQLSFSSTLSSPQCAASFVLACLASSIEEALCASLQDQQANASSSEPGENATTTSPDKSTGAGSMLAPVPPLKRLRDTTAAAPRPVPKATQALPSRARKCSGAKPCWPGAPGNGGVARSAAANRGVARPTPSPLGMSAPAALQPPNGASGHVAKQARTEAAAPVRSHGAESCSTISVEEEDEDMRSIDSKGDVAKLPPSCSDKSTKHALATSDRTDRMYVTCGAQEQFPLVPAVRFIYRATVGRYCGVVRPGTLRKVCARALVGIEEMLKGVHRAIEVRNPSPAHACTGSDGCFFRSMADHVSGLLLTARSEVQLILRELPSMVSAADGRPKQSGTALQDNAACVMASVRMGRLLLAQDCAPLLHLLMVDAVVPLIALDGVEDMHAQIFKSLQLQDVQRSAMATFWRQWVQRRRALDETTAAAAEALSTVPITFRIPDLVQTQVSVLCGDKKSVSCGTGDAKDGKGGSAEPPIAWVGYGGGGKRYCATSDRMFVQASGCTALADVVCTQQHGLHARLRTVVGPLESEEPCSDDSCIYAEGGARDFVGQNGAHMQSAATALKQLVSVHAADKDMYLDCLDAQMPNSMLSASQVVRMGLASLLYTGGPFDFLNLCQMAATQERRIELLQNPNEPFTGALMDL